MSALPVGFAEEHFDAGTDCDVQAGAAQKQRNLFFFIDNQQVM